MSHTNLMRAIAGDPARWARLADRLGECRPGQALTIRTLADDTGDAWEATAQLLACWESLEWVIRVESAAGRCYRPTSKLPSVNVLDESEHALASLFLSAAMTINVRGRIATCD